MRIARLSSRGITALPDLECDFVSRATGRPHDLIVVSGPPASGKTRVLELMLAALESVGPLLGIVRSADWVADRAKGARVELGIWLNDEELAASSAMHNPTRAVVRFGGEGVDFEIDRGVGRLLARYDHDRAHGKREYFPEGRQRAWGARVDGVGALEQSLLRSSKDPQKYGFVPRFLAELGANADRASVFVEALATLSPTVRYIPVATPDHPIAGFSNRDGEGVRYTELSGSETDAVLIAATTAMVGLCHSTVFLDRPELFVDADRLVPWVKSLATVGTDNQWIVATADARLAAAADPSQVVALGTGSNSGQGDSFLSDSASSNAISRNAISSNVVPGNAAMGNAVWGNRTLALGRST